MTLSLDAVRALPKVVLHDHLDGGLRPLTLVELAAEAGHELPSTDPATLADHMHQGARRGDLVAYLEAFVHTVAALQSAAGIERVAREALEDLAADGVVYAELRFAPELNTADGLSMHEVVDAALAGLAAGPIPAGLIVDGMRTSSPRVVAAAANVAIARAGEGVVGFDLAGAEAYNPAALHAKTLRRVVDAGLGLTLHAGEAHGPTMVAEAVDRFGATRIGHGVTLAHDIAPDGTLGPTAARVRDLGVILEVCPTSNLHTSAVASIADHPIDRFRHLGLAVTVNTDNRLMSSVTMSSEVHACAHTFGWDADVVVELARTAMRGAFCDDATRTKVMATINQRAPA